MYLAPLLRAFDRLDAEIRRFQAREDPEYEKWRRRAPATCSTIRIPIRCGGRGSAVTKTLDHRRSVTQLALRRAGIPVVESDRPDGGRAPSIVALDRRIGRLVRFHCGLRSPGRRPVRDLDGLRTAGTTSPATRSRRRPRRFDVHGVPAARRAGRTGVSGFSARRRAGRCDVHRVSARRRTGAFFASASISVYPRCRRVSVNSALEEPGVKVRP